MKESKTVLQSMVKGDLAQKRLSEIDDEEDEVFTKFFVNFNLREIFIIFFKNIV